MTAAEGTVQSQIRLDVHSNWVNVPAAANQAKGIVTGTDPTPSNAKDAGDILYTVDLRPVVIAEGKVPAFRDLSEGDEGADVALLQAFLRSNTFFAGDPDGKFGYGTRAAVQAWQKSLEVTTDGRVRLGDIVFVDVLPSVITADPKIISRGMPVIGGEAALSVRSVKPEFSIALSKKQIDQVKTGQIVDIEHDGGLWKAAIAEVTPDPEQNGNGAIATLKPSSGDSICESDCASIAASGPSSFRGKVTLQEPISGIILPSAALITNNTGKTQVIQDNGLAADVEILGSANGQTVVSGIDAGQVIRAPGKPATSTDQ
ncbi:peptidoglycan-binding protein [Arthrobacter sp. GMC3]|uniref:peptidoglycan-binding domain-containing protein n=1 Tax=Arthrobacter sp. GMC3 TaxID=2058894 RepID=UPI0015E28154|nr:peptidoglycan-binding domain-containing protein [Arthrobacter sp. GMC3]